MRIIYYFFATRGQKLHGAVRVRTLDAQISSLMPWQSATGAPVWLSVRKLFFLHEKSSSSLLSFLKTLSQRIYVVGSYSFNSYLLPFGSNPGLSRILLNPNSNKSSRSYKFSKKGTESVFFMWKVLRVCEKVQGRFERASDPLLKRGDLALTREFFDTTWWDFI